MSSITPYHQSRHVINHVMSSITPCQTLILYLLLSLPYINSLYLTLPRQVGYKVNHVRSLTHTHVTFSTIFSLSLFSYFSFISSRQVASNAGLDATDIVSALRAKHHSGKRWEGVDVDEDGTCDTVEKFVWEPALVKQNAIAAATEAACMILSVDETVKNAKSESLTNDKPVH